MFYTLLIGSRKMEDFWAFQLVTLLNMCYCFSSGLYDSFDFLTSVSACVKEVLRWVKGIFRRSWVSVNPYLGWLVYSLSIVYKTRVCSYVFLRDEAINFYFCWIWYCKFSYMHKVHSDCHSTPSSLMSLLLLLPGLSHIHVSLLFWFSLIFGLLKFMEET